MLVPTSPVVLSTAFVETLRSIPELVAILGGNADAISYYLDTGDLLLDILSLAKGSILVACVDTYPVDHNTGARWRSVYVLYIKPPNAEVDHPNPADQIRYAIQTGIPTNADGQRFPECTFLDSIMPVGYPKFHRVITPRDEPDYWEAIIALDDLGIDDSQL